MTKDEQIEMIRDALQILAPTHLIITDDSHKHAGHGGARDGFVTHIGVQIASQKLTDLSRVAQHRLVMQALQPLMDDFLHAVQVTIIGCE